MTPNKLWNLLIQSLPSIAPKFQLHWNKCNADASTSQSNCNSVPLIFWPSKRPNSSKKYHIHSLAITILGILSLHLKTHKTSFWWYNNYIAFGVHLIKYIRCKQLFVVGLIWGPFLPTVNSTSANTIIYNRSQIFSMFFFQSSNFYMAIKSFPKRTNYKRIMLGSLSSSNKVIKSSNIIIFYISLSL